MSLYQSVQAASNPLPAVPTADSATDLIAIFADWVVPAGLAAADVVEMCPLPPGYVPVDVIAAFQSCAATITMDCGMLTGQYGNLLDDAGAARVCGSEFFAAASFATAGLQRANKYQGLVLNPIQSTGSNAGYVYPVQSVGFKVGATVTTLVPGATVRLTLMCRPMADKK